MTGKAMVRKDGAYLPVEVDSLSTGVYQCRNRGRIRNGKSWVKCGKSFFDLKKEVVMQ